MGVESHSEYEGGGVMPNTVFPKGNDALTSSDKLRLDSITGQTEDSQAPVDPYHWQGGAKYHPDEMKPYEDAARARAVARRQLDRDERARYKETPY